MPGCISTQEALAGCTEQPIIVTTPQGHLQTQRWPQKSGMFPEAPFMADLSGTSGHLPGPGTQQVLNKCSSTELSIPQLDLDWGPRAAKQRPSVNVFAIVNL